MKVLTVNRRDKSGPYPWVMNCPSCSHKPLARPFSSDFSKTISLSEEPVVDNAINKQESDNDGTNKDTNLLSIFPGLPTRVEPEDLGEKIEA
jgi:hypothetical protein